MRHLKFFGTCDVLSRSPYSESVVLAGNQHPPGLGLPNGVVTATMAIRQLRGLSAEGQADKLVAKADPEGGESRLRELPDHRKGVGHGGRVPWTVRQEQAIRLQLLDPGGQRLGRNH